MILKWKVLNIYIYNERLDMLIRRKYMGEGIGWFDLEFSV